MIRLYYQVTGSDNHGCEAINRSTAKLLNNGVVLYSYDKKADEFYGVDKELLIQDDSYEQVKKLSLQWMIAAIYKKITNSELLFTEYGRGEFFEQISHGDVCLSVGGDNYCYKGQEYLGYYNKIIHKHGGKTVLWGCSIEPGMVTDAVKKDFALYDLIVARESISYEFLKSINKNTIYACDPAFTLEADEIILPKNFKEGETVGINISPIIQSREQENGITIRNIKDMISHIIDNTNYNIALIPHVVNERNDDRRLLDEIYEWIPNKSRVCMIHDCNCRQLKGYISKCRMFIGARTHATIAAYSSYVPTLVIGYSTKAIGIARDLFGNEEHYVLPVQSLNSDEQIKKAFIWLDNNQDEIKEHLKSVIPDYSKTIYQAANAVMEMAL